MSLQITQFNNLVVFDGLRYPVVNLPETTVQNLTVGVTSVQSAALNSDTRLVRILSNEACRIAAGVAPVATASSMFIPADVAEYFGVRPGDKLAVIAA